MMAGCCWHMSQIQAYAELYELGMITAGDFAELVLGVL